MQGFVCACVNSRGRPAAESDVPIRAEQVSVRKTLQLLGPGNQRGGGGGWGSWRGSGDNGVKLRINVMCTSSHVGIQTKKQQKQKNNTLLKVIHDNHEWVKKHTHKK